MVSREILLKSVLTIGTGLFLLLEASAYAAPVAGGTLDPTTIPKYVIPLVIPPEMPKSTIQPGAPTADYNIAVRQFKQQILPGGVWNTVNGRADAFGATTVWSYGRAQETLPTNFVAPVPLSSNISFNYPAFTVENTSGTLTKVRWINDLVNPVTRNFLPHLLAVDQTLHWANPPAVGCSDGTNRTDCMTMNPAPYTGPVPLITHVHGSHVNQESDGFPEAWYLPAANNIPAGYARKGSKFDQFNRTNAVPGSAFFGYENKQPAATLWYHDHALGMTRNNVYAGPAGFWLIRGGANDTAAGILPGPAPRIGAGDPNFNAAVRATIREIPIAIQDRSFNADGSLFYPSNRAFFEQLGVPGGAQFPGTTATLNIPFVPNSDIAPIWNPEAFFNTMVVNGNTWPQLEVAPARYRLRLLDGCNSRTLNLAMFVVTGPGPDTVMGTADDTLGQEVPFFQIGAEQGFLPNVVMIQTGFATPLPGNGTIPITLTPAPTSQHALLMGPAERADVIVDFSSFANGTVVRMINTGPDFPFGGFPDVPADLGTTGQVMQFVVNSALTQASDAATTLPQNLILPAEGPLGAQSNTRQVTLNEEESGQVCVTVAADGSVNAIPNVVFDPANPATFVANCTAARGVPFAPKAAKLGIIAANGTSMSMQWMDNVTENPLLNSTEMWEIFNTTVDGHPIHLHLVRFEVVERQAIDTALLPFLAPTGPVEPPHPNELGYKDTVIALPGQITRIKAKFDIPGLYVWHCHIVEHEDNEMMRPYVVRFDPAKPDFNQDGLVNNTDYSILLAEIRKPAPRNPAFDLNNDGKVDLFDAKAFYNTRGPI